MMYANFAVGQNWPVSMELMVFLETPTILARSDWEIFFSDRISFILFFNTNVFSIYIIIR